jgi:hypothetical protein
VENFLCFVFKIKLRRVIMFTNTRFNMMLVFLSSILFSCGTPEVNSSPTSEVDRTMTVYLRAKSPNVDWVSDGDFTYHIHYWGNGSASNWNSLPELTLVSEGIYSYTFQPSELDDYAPTSLLFLRKNESMTIVNQTKDLVYVGNETIFTLTSWTSLDGCGDCVPTTTKSDGTWAFCRP